VVTVTWLAGAPDDAVEVAYAVSRRAGTAVVRNRIRRRLRAVVRSLAAEPGGLAPGAYLLAAGAEGATLPFDELRRLVADGISAAQGARS
jgi:ribonuclease P protein component